MSQYQPRNWQNLLDFLTSKAKEDGILDDVKKFTGQEDVLEICLKEEFYRKKLLEWIISSISVVSIGKSPSKASHYRQLGNAKFRCKDNDGSLAMYTESIRYAPEKSEDLSLAYANRSAALFHMECFQSCLEDISLALQKEYPLHLHYKLYLRKGQCLKKLGKYEEAMIALKVAKKTLEHVKDVPDSKKCIGRKI